MKKLIALILLTAIAFSACTDYIALAEQRLAPPYPSYFGAAGEYNHAADCYLIEKDFTKSNHYYKMAGDYYVTAAESLVEGGDNFLKARAYENAATSYAKINMDDKAVQYYEESRTIFTTHGYTEEANRITGLIIGLNAPDAIDFGNIFGILSLIIFIIALVSILYLFTQNVELRERLSRLKRKKKPKAPTLVKRSSAQFVSHVQPKQTIREVKVNVKDKYAKKLREKYMPK